MVQFELKKDTPKIENNRHWQFCVGSGQAKLALRSDYAALLKKVHDELGIQRVRFHGIFDDSMETYMGLDDFMPLPGSSNFKNYNFRNIGIAYDNVLAAGMQPWVELSFLPSRLAKGGKKGKKVTVNADGKCVMPKDDREWKDFIQAFIRFLLHRYGAEELHQWFFEVWNEPNMNTFFNGSMQDYFHLYEITAKAVKEVDPQIRVGGPATATGGWITEFIDFCEAGNVPLDFISTHNYPGDGIGAVFDEKKVILESVANGMKKLKKMGSGRALDGCRCMMQDKSEIDDMPKGQMYEHTKMVYDQVAGRYPIYYTEWNCNAILTSPTNDMKKVACFQTKSISEMDRFVTGSSIWCFSDIFDEFLMFPDPFSGGFGLLTIDGIPKPQYYALQLMNQTGDRKYDLPYTNGEVEISAYEGEDEIMIFVYRQQMKNSDAPAMDYEVSVELDAAPGAVGFVKIDDDNANPLQHWIDLGKPYEMNREEIAAFIQETMPVERQVETAYKDGSILLCDALKVNDVHCYIIKRSVTL